MNAEVPKFGETDLTNCDREPIHIPGSIQPHGLLLAYRLPAATLTYASFNVHTHLAPDTFVWDAPLEALVSVDLAQKLRALPEISDTQASLYCSLPLPTPTGEAQFALLAHRHKETLLIELENLSSAPPSNDLEAYHQVAMFAARLQRAPTLTELWNAIVEVFHELTGFDRVLMYRFDPDWNGEVIAERCDEALESYLGLHYPASDIPAQARDLYTRNLLRFVPTVHYAPVPVQTHDPKAPALDMSYCLFRSVSPIHLEYLRNMGVAATLVASVLTADRTRLWGLITCNNSAPRSLPPETRFKARFLSQIASERIAAKIAEEAQQRRAHLQTIEASLVRAISEAEDVVSVITTHQDEILALTEAQGAALLLADRVIRVGETPEEAQILALGNLLNTRLRVDSLYTDSLSALYPEGRELAATASGLIAVHLGREPGDYLLWFRPEVIQTVSWGGDPNKPVTMDETGLRLSPRKSFALWQQTLHGKSLPWNPIQYERAVVFGIYLGNRLYENMRIQALQEVERLRREDAERRAVELERELRAPESAEASNSEEHTQVPLRLANPEIFQEYVAQYAELLETALEERTFKVATTLPQRARAFAQALGAQDATANDVVEIHTEALRSKMTDTAPLRTEAYLQEGRILSLSVMGHLLMYYRLRG